MRKLVNFLMTFLVGSSLSYVNADTAQINFEAGYRRDNIRFRVEAPSCDPLFETTTRFKELDIFQIGVCAKTHLCYNLYGRASANWGWILEGDLEETSKIFVNIPGISGEGNFEHRNRDRNIVDGRYVVDLDVAVGYPFYFCDCSIALAPVVGYAFNEQNVRVEDAASESFAIVDGLFVQNSGGCCCDSKFISRWFGPFVGLDFQYRACDSINLYAQLEYHWARFHGRRQAHSGFEISDEYRRTSRNGYGWAFKLGLEYEMCDEWTVGLSASWKDFRVHKRHGSCSSDFDEFSGLAGFSSGSDNNRFGTKDSWRSGAINITVGRMF
jgi:opacity protein-like surface antigen